MSHSVFRAIQTSSLLQALPLSLPVGPYSTRSPPAPWQFTASTTAYFSATFAFIIGLQLFLLVPMRLAWKQCVAAPVLAALFILPLVLVSTESPAIQLMHAGVCISTFMRMFDLYFVTPWRIGREPVLDFDEWRREMWRPFRNICVKDKMKQDTEDKKTIEPKVIGGLQQQQRRYNTRQSQHENAVPSVAKHGSPPAPQRTLCHWTFYLPRYIFYMTTVEVTTFVFSFMTVEQIQSLSIIPRFFVLLSLAICIICFISLWYYSNMFAWAILTGGLIDDTDWTYVRHGFPLFATSPDDFWKRWHHLFQYIWIDLGLKPTKMLLRKYVTGKNMVHHRTAAVLEMALPVMSVFVLSGLMHEYMFMTTWPDYAGYMMAYFLIQGVATLASKGLQIALGRRFGGVVPVAVWVVLTVLFNAATGALFLEPIIRNGGLVMGARQSVLVRLYNYLRANSVF
ncbi:hypothetical protein BGZ74_008710 [Mortierella antarctica]|nr:hypothetical protein BGZ74_008710 [Mortierella antarctica]